MKSALKTLILLTLMPLLKSPLLYLDENLSPRLAEQLRKYGFDAIAVKESNLLARSDAEQLAFAVTQKRALVTINFSDFVSLHETYKAKDQEHFGIIFTTEQRFGTMLNRLLKLLNSLTVEDLKNQIRWLNEFK
jgi:predicted nuclease of predicted toxin-antitoxin system